MTNKLDTSWFDLKNYDALSTLDLSGWEMQLSVRCNMRKNKAYLDLNDGILKTNPIFNHATPFPETCNGWHDPNIRPYNTYSVMSSPDLYGWRHRVGDKPNIVTMDLSAAYGYDARDDRLGQITIDLTATDEQINSDFSRWLTGYRESIGYESYKNNFTDRDLSEWVRWQLLPYIDLILIADFEGKNITQKKIADLIYPHDEANEVNTIERLRKTTKPKAEWLFRNETLQAMAAQVTALAPSK